MTPSPNIIDTVQSRLKEVKDAEATVEAKHQLLDKAVSKATSEAGQEDAAGKIQDQPTGGGCFFSSNTSAEDGLANTLLMFAPLWLIIGFRKIRKIRQ